MRLATVVAAVILASAGMASATGSEHHNNEGGNSNSSQEQNQAQVSETTYEDSKNAASGAPSLALAQCSSGASAQVFGGGGSLGGPDVVCSLLNVAVVSAQLGDAEGSATALAKAQQIMAYRTNPVLRFLQAIPILRHLF